MFEVYHWQIAELMGFGLVFLRVSACFAVMPIFGTRLIPLPIKVLVSLVMSLVLFPPLRGHVPFFAEWDATTAVYAMREIAIGVLLGFLTRLMFTAVDIAGQVIGFATGLNTASIVNPSFGESESSIQQFQSNLVMLLFLAINGHFFFLEAMNKSFHLAPIGMLAINPLVILSTNQLIQEVFVTGIQLAGPLLAVTVVMNLAQGIIGRVVPQINVFITSLQVNVLVGLVVFGATIPFLMTVVESGFGLMTVRIMSIVEKF